MPIRSLLVAIVLLVGIGVAVWFANQNPVAEEQQNKNGEVIFKPVDLLKVEAGDVASIEVLRAEDPVKLAPNAKGKWEVYVAGEKTLPADRERVDQILRALNPLTTRRIFEKANPAQYGLGNAGSTVKLNLKSGKNYTIHFGDELPTGGERYAQLEGDTRIVIINANEYMSLNSRPQDLRDKRMLPLDAEAVTRVEFANAKDSMVFARDGKQWKMLQPAPYRMNGTTVESLLSMIDKSTLQFVTAQEAASLAAAFAAGELVARIALTEDGQVSRAEIRKSKDGSYLAKSTALEQVIKLDGENGQGFEMEIGNFRVSDVFEFGFDDLDELTIRDGATTVKFVHKDDEWSRDGQPMDGLGVQTLIDKIRETSAQSFPKGPEPKPELVIAVKWNGRQEQATMGAVADGYVVRRAGDPILYQITKEQVAEIRRALAEVKPKAAQKK